HAFANRQNARSSTQQGLSDTGRSSDHGLAGLASSHPTDTRSRNRGIDARRLHPIATSPSGDSAAVCWNSSFEKCNKYQQIPLFPLFKGGIFFGTNFNPSLEKRVRGEFGATDAAIIE